MNKFEQMKQTKDGLDVLPEIPRFAEEGFESISADDLERLKWAGIFHRRPTTGYFMMRIRFPSGVASTAQIRTLATIVDTHGRGLADITTRQQIEPRWLRIEEMPRILETLAAAGLTSLQTGMDNIRGVVGCSLAGLYPRELIDASPLCAEFQDSFLGDKAYTNLPRKFNVIITGCPDNCTDAATQDVALVPAVQDVNGEETLGFNILVGGKQGSGGFVAAQPLDVFVLPADAAAICRELVLTFRDHGPRQARSRARFAFLVEDQGLGWIRAMVESRLGHDLLSAGRDARSRRHVDHVGVTPQRQAGLNAVGLLVPVGRVTSAQLREAARLADEYGKGGIRLTPGQNLVLPHIPDDRLAELVEEPLVQEWTPNPSPVMRGLVSCTGAEFCNLALIETKTRALEIGRELEKRLPPDRPLTMRWSGCPAACGNHLTADLGLQGKRIRLEDGRIVDAVAIFTGGRSGPGARGGQLILDDVPCDERLPDLLASLAVGEGALRVMAGVGDVA